MDKKQRKKMRKKAINYQNNHARSGNHIPPISEALRVANKSTEERISK